MSLYGLWLRKGPSIKYVRYWWGNRWSSEITTIVHSGRCCYNSCVRVQLHYLFSCFWQHFCLKVSCFICRNLTLLLFKKDVFVRKGYFSTARSISVVSLFTLNYICEPKLTKTLLILIKYYLRYNLYFSMIRYFEKSLVT